MPPLNRTLKKPTNTSHTCTLPSSRRTKKFDGGSSPPPPPLPATLPEVAAKTASPSVIRHPGRHLIASMRSRTHTRLVAAAPLLPPPPHIPTPVLPAAALPRRADGSEAACTSCPLLVEAVLPYLPESLPFSCLPALPLPPPRPLAAGPLVARRGELRCADPRFGLFRPPPPFPPAADRAVARDTGVPNAVAEGLEAAPAAAPAVAAPRAGGADVADGAGDTKEGEAGAAVVEAQVEAGDSEACTDREVVVDPGVLGSADSSALGGVDAAAAAAAVVVAVAVAAAPAVGEGGAINSSSPRHKRSKGTLSCWEVSQFCAGAASDEQGRRR